MEEVIIDLPQPQKNIYDLIEEKIGVSFSELSYQELITEESFKIERKEIVFFGTSKHEEVFLFNLKYDFKEVITRREYTDFDLFTDLYHDYIMSKYCRD